MLLNYGDRFKELNVTISTAPGVRQAPAADA